MKENLSRDKWVDEALPTDEKISRDIVRSLMKLSFTEGMREERDLAEKAKERSREIASW